MDFFDFANGFLTRGLPFNKTIAMVATIALWVTVKKRQKISGYKIERFFLAVISYFSFLTLPQNTFFVPVTMKNILQVLVSGANILRYFLKVKKQHFF